MLFALSLALPLAAVGYSLLYLLFGGGLGVRYLYLLWPKCSGIEPHQIKPVPANMRQF